MQISLSYSISPIYVLSSCVCLFVQSVPRRLHVLLFILHKPKSGCNSPTMYICYISHCSICIFIIYIWIKCIVCLIWFARFNIFDIFLACLRGLSESSSTIPMTFNSLWLLPRLLCYLYNPSDNFRFCCESLIKKRSTARFGNIFLLETEQGFHI